MAAAATYNISAPAVVNGTAVTLTTVIAQGRATFTLNDAATVGAASDSNLIMCKTLNANDPHVVMSWPCATGLVVSKILGIISIVSG